MIRNLSPFHSQVLPLHDSVIPCMVSHGQYFLDYFECLTIVILGIALCIVAQNCPILPLFLYLLICLQVCFQNVHFRVKLMKYIWMEHRINLSLCLALSGHGMVIEEKKHQHHLHQFCFLTANPMNYCCDVIALPTPIACWKYLERLLLCFTSVFHCMTLSHNVLSFMHMHTHTQLTLHMLAVILIHCV